MSEPFDDYNADQDAHDSYIEAVRAIGARVKAGEPIPPFFQSEDQRKPAGRRQKPK